MAREKRIPKTVTKFGKEFAEIMLNHPILSGLWDAKVISLPKGVSDKDIVKSIMEDWEYQASIKHRVAILPYSTECHVKLKRLKF